MSGVRFECTQCGKCCTARGEYAYVYLNPDEVAELARFLELGAEEFRARYTLRDEHGWTQLVTGDRRCIFLGDDGRTCRVYPARPAQCRSFPFWPEFLPDGEWTGEVRELCEGVDRGRVYPVEEVAARMLEFTQAEED